MAPQGGIFDVARIVSSIAGIALSFSSAFFLVSSLTTPSYA